MVDGGAWGSMSAEVLAPGAVDSVASSSRWGFVWAGIVVAGTENSWVPLVLRMLYVLGRVVLSLDGTCR